MVADYIATGYLKQAATDFQMDIPLDIIPIVASFYA